MELRDIEIFLTLAEELHFGRSAERLHVSPARVSQAIKKQERAIGAELFERTSRQVRLTPVGEVLLQRMKPAYEGVQDAMAAVVEAARRAAGTLTLGVLGAQMHEIAPVLARFRSRHPSAELRFREIFFSDPFGALRAGTVDAAITWLPVREPDLTVGVVLREEPLHLMVSAHHPLAGRDSVSIEVLGDHVVPRLGGGAPADWQAGVLPVRTPSGRPVRRGAEVSTFHEVLALVATGDVVCTVPDEGRRYNPLPGIAYVPLHDAPPVRWALIWCSDRETPLIRAFAEVARPSGAPGSAG
ncbi:MULTISPECIES: LysR family transcriptional regulator [unclassified Streptomyces]|uniref:LysR family transcriptional regulator n=1 Tax=unclassified Streptomyces TaxID=2593676 RepID=UPI0006F6F906|nr:MULTISPECIES: LysR family transcriptional regulator [unclassified Streptomyces]KQX49798.1 LysR family transcriptional regulator [Streptomyces sp. Root1304]KRA80157.1 LysR family transcriptional regulator [Streptomyces sp. Root66D1]